MTRKHFKAIAEAVRQMNGHGSDLIAKDQIIWRLADALSEFNPNFDRTRFSRACRGEK